MNVWVAYPYLLPQSYHNHSALHAAARPPETLGPKTGPHAVARAGWSSAPSAGWGVFVALWGAMGAREKSTGLLSSRRSSSPAWTKFWN